MDTSQNKECIRDVAEAAKEVARVAQKQLMDDVYLVPQEEMGDLNKAIDEWAKQTQAFLAQVK